ncbi:restriction endonuclease subunit S [Phaeovulum sp.]|uniref:restriction endonuclease subunit S n=1 Tax=Phaeovulum sp. TaxID=2934796 RepID=UPI0039E2AA94
MTDLPNSWLNCRFGELIKVRNGFAFKSKEFLKARERDDDIPLVRQSQLRGSTVDLSNAVYLPAGYLEKFADYRIDQGDILIGMSGSIGKVCYYTNEAPALQNQRTGKLATVAGDALEGRFFGFCLLSVEKQLQELSKGMGVQNISAKDIENLTIPLPPVNEQRRIVEKIEALFDEIDKGVESLGSAKNTLGLYRQSLLSSLVQPEVEDFGPKVDLAFVVKKIGQGWSPKCKNNPSPTDETWGVIKTTAIQAGRFNDEENKELPEALAPREQLELKENDILITRAGPRNRVGIACMVRKIRPRLLLCDKAYRLTVDCNRILPQFLEALLNAPKIQQSVEDLKSGINDSGLNLTQNRFLSLQFRLPTLDKQAEITRILDARLDAAARLEAEIDAALTRADALRQSTLKKAFSGQLVPQDPSDEPAAVLLERIKAERVITPKTKKKRNAHA